jgi:CDP-diacylglycerol--glycerol-3-phosphate 3-phosphatidyltransferase
MRGYRGRQAWELTTAASATAVTVLAGVLAVRWAGLLFLAAVGVAFAAEVVLVRRVSVLVGGESQRFTLPTLVTAVRGAVIAVLAGFVVTGRPSGALAWLPALLFGGASLLDWVDGLLARTTGSVSAFGARLDTEVDALALLVGPAVAVRFGVAPAVYLAVGLARYAFVAGLAVRRYRGRPVGELDEGPRQRLLAAMQMLVVAVVLVPVLDTGLTRLLAVAGMVPFLLGFARDWLLVTRGGETA